eukprot:TRINITY_DN22049_c0_g1_i2.p1 TRINITY_DN22049_c0_g1~~TRINITY_DN22049_c0_g1_i2.p1  ORF type:complete len:234 (-),score=28.06 TRINITY_DN22049_c0_g1_i2:21-722(-)
MVTIVEVSDYEVSCNSLLVLNTDSESTSTVTLLCKDGLSVVVQSQLLKRFSQVFGEVLNCTEYGKGIPVKEESWEWEAFIRLLEAHTNGNYNLDTATIVNTVIMADKYDFQAVIRICDEYLAASPNVILSTDEQVTDWVFAWLVFSERYSLKRTKDRCLKFIQMNTKQIDFEAEEVMKCLASLGMEVTLMLLQFIVTRLNDVDTECSGVKNACKREGLELHDGIFGERQEEWD